MRKDCAMPSLSIFYSLPTSKMKMLIA